MRTVFFGSALLAMLMASRAALAHQASVTYLDFDVHGRDADVEVRIAAPDLADPLGLSPLLPVSRSEAMARAARAAGYVSDRLELRNDGVLCRTSPGATAIRPRGDSFYLALAVRYECPRQIDDLGIRYRFLFDIDPAHQGMAEIRAFGSTQEHVFRREDQSFRVAGQPSRVAEFADYLTLGIEHIFTGYDHIAFLFGLLIIAAARGARPGVRYALGVVTAFTVAHSITLACAALDLVRLPSRWVESAIAASILYVAVENVVRSEPRARWRLTFLFGLVHGFGFASVLRELGLPRNGLALSLAAFNAGVEVGQLMVVSAAFPLLLLILRSVWRVRDFALAILVLTAATALLTRFGVPFWTVVIVAYGGSAMLAAAAREWGYDRGVRVGGSLVIAALAILWLAERVSGRVVAHGRIG